MAAGAPYGNKNAEKWTFRKAVELFHDAIVLSNTQESYFLKQGEKAVEVKGYQYDFIGEIARKLGTFHEIFTHLSKRFPVLHRLKSELDNNIQSNCYSNGKKGAIKEASSIMNLKANWKWSDRIDHTSGDKEMKLLTDTEREEKIKELKKKLGIKND